MKLKDNDPFNGMQEFQETFVKAENIYNSGAYAPLDPYPSLSKTANKSLPRGYFTVTVEKKVERDGFVVLTLVGGELPVGRSGQYTSIKVSKKGGYASSFPAYFVNYPSSDAWKVFIPKQEELTDFVNSVVEGGELSVTRPRGDYGYNVFRDAKKAYALVTEDTVAPVLSMLDGIKKGKYDFDLTVNFFGKIDPYLASELGKVGGKVNYYDSVKDCLPDYKGYETVYAPISSQKEVNALARSLTAEPKYLREIVLFEPIKKIENAKECKIVVHAFDNEYVLSARQGEKLIDVLERSNVKIESRCRNGECGWCRVLVKKGSVSTAGSKPRAADTTFGYVHACRAVINGDLEIRIDY